MPRFVPALASAGLLVAAAAVALNLYVNQQGIGVVPSPSATAPPSPIASTMWPQSTLDEVRTAQELADAGDPAYTWQVDPLLVQGRWMDLVEGRPDVADRFLHEVLGWDEYMVNVYPGRADSNAAADGVLSDISYLRCAPVDAKPLEQNDVCASTLDDLHYETVSIDLAQLDRQGPDGIWVVSDWRMTAPYAPVTEVTALLDTLLQARIDGHGAEGLVSDPGSYAIPLLYATTSGAPYERYEHELVHGPWWPMGSIDFKVRLFAEGGATVVEQDIGWVYWLPAELGVGAATTTENGQRVPVQFDLLDGDASAFATYPWGSDCADECMAWRSEAGSGYVYLAELPLTVMNSCLAEAADPTPANVGSIAALAIEGAGGTECLSFENWWGEGKPVRIYQIDLPDGSSMRTVGIVVVGDGAPLDDVIAAATPMIESIEFHVP